MHAVVVYESLYGNTHAIAERIADGLRPSGEVTVVPVARAQADLVDAADLLVVGGPTHVHGMSSEMSRKAGREDVAKHPELELDPDAAGPGLRDWFAELHGRGRPAAAFDTRLTGPPALTGRAAKGISRRLRSHGFRVVIDPESFLVDKQNRLVERESERAQAWGGALAAALGRHATPTA
jgi:hypothetical protein